MKITQIELIGNRSIIHYRATFNHPHRGNNHRGTVSLEQAQRMVDLGKQTTIQEALQNHINYVLNHGNQIRVGREDLSDFTKPEDLPDITEIVELAKIVFKPEMQESVIVRDDKRVMVKPKLEYSPELARDVLKGRNITPLCNPKEVAPDCPCIDEICAVVHTPEVKAAYKASLPPRVKTRKEERPVERIEVIDGQPVLMKKSDVVHVPVMITKAVVDEAGKPVIRNGRPLTYDVPVMEEQA